jgi:hypothetical protein
MSLLPNLDQMTDNEKLAVLESIQKSIAESKEIQKKKIGENVDLVVQALKKIEADIRDRFDAVGNTIEKRVASIKDGRDGANGTDGRDGKDGKSGRDGLKGDRGVDGQAGRDGVDGVDGVSVTNAHIDFDGSLVISLSDGRELNVGEVVSQDIAEKIKVISTMSTNAAIAVKEEGSTLTNGVKSINFVGTGITATTSGDDVTVTVAGGGGSGTVTSVAATAGTGISVTGSPITTSGTLTITNTAPDQTVALTQGGTTTITGTYPNFTISSADQFQGTVTSVTGTSPVASSGGATPAISLSAGYGDTLNPYASKTANFVLAAPDGTAGVPTFRAVVAADIPTLNQNTTGTASNVTGTVAIANGGTGATTAATALTNLGAVAKAGDTMTGALGFVAGSASTPSLFASGDTNTGIFFPAADTIGFAEGGAEAMRIDSDGDVGIGTATPGYKLDVQSSASSGAPLLANFQAAGGDVQVYIQNGTVKTQINADATNSASIIGSFSNHPLSLRTNNTERMRIDSSGNVGIGTSSPSYKLEVRSTMAVLDGSANIGFYVNNTNFTQVWQTFQSPNDLLIKTTAAKYIAFLPNNTEAMRIDSSGNVIVGGTSTSSDESTYQGGGVFVSRRASSAGTTHANFLNGGSTVGSITSNTTATFYNTTSDYRLKENATPVTTGLQTIAALNPVNFNWVSNRIADTGFLAHEFQSVIPNCVMGTKDAIDANGNPVYQQIDRSGAIPFLVAAIQEQQALITALTARITALENK